MTAVEQVLKPMWPFIVAGSITIYAIAKIQETAVRCELTVPSFASVVDLCSTGIRQQPKESLCGFHFQGGSPLDIAIEFLFIIQMQVYNLV